MWFLHVLTLILFSLIMPALVFLTADVFSRPTMTCDVFYVTAVLLHFHMMLVVKLVGLYHFMILVN